MASASVSTTCVIEMRTNFDVLYGISHFIPAGKNFDSSSMRFWMACAVANALAVGASCTPMPVDGLPSMRAVIA
jgi:hypothetical protein